MASRCIPIGFALAVAAVSSGCATVGGYQPNMLTTEQEIQLGAKLAAEVKEQEQVLDDPVIQGYVQGIADELTAFSPRQDVAYRATVIDDPDSVNAFALPGGYCFFYTGLLTMCENEAELAGVMAHEMAHVAAHHHGETLTRQYNYNTLASLLLGENPGELAQLAAQVIGAGYLTRYSRDQEREADALGMDMMFRAGYKPGAMAAFMEKLMRLQGGGGGYLPIFASHPPTSERHQRLRYFASQRPAVMRQNAVLNAERYRETILQRLPE
jgi:predicted Zn-dependent protease